MLRNRRSYTASKKLEVIKHYKETNNYRETGRFFSIAESTVREWVSKEPIISKIRSTKRAMRYSSVKFPELEHKLKEWVVDMRNKFSRVSTVRIIRQAKILANDLGLVNFVGQPSWCYNFMKRNNLSNRCITSIGQKLPIDWEAKVENFRKFIIDNSHDTELYNIGNMDEVPISFDLPKSRTVNLKGAKEITVCTTGHEKTNCTVVLAITYDGSKLPPMVIFKKKNIPKEKFPSNIIVQCNSKGWINEEVMKIWLEKVWKKRNKESFFNSKSLLIMDSCKAHTTSEIKMLIGKYSKLAIIPGGLTKKLQPLDLTVNRSFKENMRRRWEDWMIAEAHDYTKSGRIKRISYAGICNWIADSWYEVEKSCVINGFNVSFGKDLTTEIGLDADRQEMPDLPEEILTSLKSLQFIVSDDDYDGFED